MSDKIEQAMATVLRRIRLRGDSPVKAVGDLWDSLVQQLSKGDLDCLAKEGLANRLHGAMSVERHLSVDRAVKVSVDYGQGGNTKSVSVLVSIMYEVEDGNQKPLISFTVEDAQFIAMRARAQATGWGQIARFMEDLCRKLIDGKAKTVASLPKSVQREIEEKWPR